MNMNKQEQQEATKACNKSQHWYRRAGWADKTVIVGEGEAAKEIKKFGINCIRCHDVLLTNQPMFTHLTD
ncbi:hypothetical protein LCGC14_0729580 [marine sediment metagenome]|uniref:Uncharacterized protein n=1 Tax=marine sediment metagenome TaxID=412755 RepID=A0A0F9SVA7_9ZZZZ